MAKTTLSRRGFLGLGAAGAVAAGLGLTSCAANGSSSDASSNAATSKDSASENTSGVSFKDTNTSESVNYTPGEIAETIDCDICVVGLGMSGLAAAVQIGRNLLQYTRSLWHAK